MRLTIRSLKKGGDSEQVFLMAQVDGADKEFWAREVSGTIRKFAFDKHLEGILRQQPMSVTQRLLSILEYHFDGGEVRTPIELGEET